VPTAAEHGGQHADRPQATPDPDVRQALRVDQITDDHILEIKSSTSPPAPSTTSSSTGQILQGRPGEEDRVRMPKIKRLRDGGAATASTARRTTDGSSRPAPSEPRALVLVLLGGDAGMRIGEIIALEWSRVDYGANKVHVEVSDWNGHIGPPKGGKPRSVPMTPRLRAALQALRAEEASALAC
jgi:hypothetical protein